MGGKNRAKGSRVGAKGKKKGGANVKIANKRQNKLKRRANAEQKADQTQRKQKRAEKARAVRKVARKTSEKNKKAPGEDEELFSLRGVDTASLNKEPAPSRPSKPKNKTQKSSISRSKPEADGGDSSDSDRILAAERRPRSARQWAHSDTKLPIKLASGQVRRSDLNPSQKRENKKAAETAAEPTTRPKANGSTSTSRKRPRRRVDDDDASAPPSKLRAAPADAKAVNPALAAARAAQQDILRVDRAKQRLAFAAEKILEDPYKHISKMDTIVAPMVRSGGNPGAGGNPGTRLDEIARLAMLTQVEIFCDILPGYRVCLPGENEKNKLISKELARERRYEASLLKSYTNLVRLLLSKARRAKKSRGSKKIKKAAASDACVARCLARLLYAAHLFNLRKDVIRASTSLLGHPDAAVRKIISDGICRLFAKDVQGDATLEVVRLISASAAQQRQRVAPETLQTFLHLNLDFDLLESGQSSADRAQSSEKRSGKRGKKAGKRREAMRELDAKLARDLNESRATADPEHKRRVQTQIISHVFTTFFRVLKRFPKSNALPVVLEGIAKYAKYINIQLVLALLEYLKVIMREALGDAGANDCGEGVGGDDDDNTAQKPRKFSRLPLLSIFHCVQAAFRTLKSHKGVISMDLDDFHKTVYRALWKICIPGEWACLPVAIQCLSDMMLVPGLPKERVMAFAKRMLIVATCVPTRAALALIHLVNRMRLLYPHTQTLIDTELPENNFSLGSFRPRLEDPDHANALSTVAWEGCVLRSSFHPYMRKYVTDAFLEAKFPAVLSRVSPADLYGQYDTSKGGFNPPLSLNTEDSGKKARRREEIMRCVHFQALRDAEAQKSV